MGTAKPALSPESRRLDLLQKMTAKTAEGKLRWHKHPKGFICQVGDALGAEFVSSYTPGIGYRWSHFILKTSNSVVAHIVNTANPIVALMRGEAPIFTAVETLFRTVVSSDDGAVERAIRALENL